MIENILYLQKYYLPTAKILRRTESVRRSPIFTYFSETITGVSVIRAFRCADRFVQECNHRIDENMKFLYASVTGNRYVLIVPIEQVSSHKFLFLFCAVVVGCRLVFENAQSTLRFARDETGLSAG